MTKTIETVYPLGIGEVRVSTSPVQLLCCGLGSCVGLFLYDRAQKIGGGAHIFLPQGSSLSNLGSTHFAPAAVESLIAQMVQEGANPQRMRAYLFGGAQLFATSQDVGRRNVEMVKKLLLENTIYLATERVGGNKPVSVSFNTGSGTFILQSTTHKKTRSWPNVS